MAHKVVKSGARVQNLTVEGFKYFRDRKEIDFGNADIVLLTGPNGSGKTSIIEALELATTGDIQLRVGQPLDNDKLKTFAYSDANRTNSTPLVSVRWNYGGYTQDSEVRIQGTRSSGEPLYGSLDKSLLSALRAQSFLYSESLGSIVGLEEKARKQWLDAFIPERSRLSGIDPRPLVTRLDVLSGQVSKELTALKSAEERILKAIAEVERCDPRLSLRRADGGWRANPLGVLRQWLNLHGLHVSLNQNQVSTPVELPSEEIRTWLNFFHNRAQALDAEEKARAASLSERAARWIAVSQILEQPALEMLERVPQPKALEEQIATRPSEEESSELMETARRDQDALRTKCHHVWHTDEVVNSQGANQSAPLGTLPLIASWKYLRSRAPEAAQRLGLPPLSPEELEGLEARERQFLQESEASLKKAEEAIQAATDDKRERQVLETRRHAVIALESAWREAEQEQPPVEHDGTYDLVKMRERARRHGREAVSSAGPTTSAQSLRNLARCLNEWADAQAALEKARREAANDPDHWKQVSDRLESVRKLLRTFDNLEPKVRAHYIQNEYQEPINRFLRRILRGYAHRPRARDQVHAHFDKQALRIRVGNPDKKSETRGLMSLSRSQYTSVMLALALATNIGKPESELGFVCLDDVSDALDLDNLAADAQLFRQLAYGPGRCRQLILTNHNEEITDRLVPKLLPPVGRSMRIIELRPSDTTEDVDVLHWDVMNEPAGRPVRFRESPLREILPE